MSTNSTPFTVQTPEDLTAKEAVELFVQTSESKMLAEVKHTFMHGPRGSGKSMNFRWLLPDVQLLKKGEAATLKELPFFAAHFGVKVTGMAQLEMSKLKDDARLTILGEHQLVLHMIVALLKSFQSVMQIVSLNEREEQECLLFFKESFVKILSQNLADFSGGRLSSVTKSSDAIQEAIAWVDELETQVKRYFVRQVTQLNIHLPWTSPIFDYNSTLEPIVSALRKLDFMCKGPVFIFVDDADYLTSEQTAVLNSFISRRRFTNISFKVGTQLSYKHYVALDGRRVEPPHDFTEIRLDIPQTGDRKRHFLELLSSVIYKRLSGYGIHVSPNDFFPEDPDQIEKIKEIAVELKNEHKDDERSYRAGDMAYRLARPEYMRRIGGIKKHLQDYSYSGFEQLAHISSGVIRNFLEPASKMFNDQLERDKDATSKLPFISPSIQDKVIREESDHLKGNLLAGFRDSLPMLYKGEERDYQSQLASNLERLVECVGAAFHAQLMNSSKTERRVFSFALSDYPGRSLKDTLQLGVREGVLLHHYIGKKDGYGKTDLYILTRRLAPTFKLDPNGFSGYLFFRAEVLERAIANPATFSNELRRRGLDIESMEVKQLTLELEGNEK